MMGLPKDDTTSYTVREQVRVPVLSLILGYGPMLPFVAGALAAWVLPSWSSPVTVLTTIWGGTILAFLSGVRRGLAFRSPGETVTQLATMLWLFLLALGAFLSTSLQLKIVVLAAGFACVGLFDWLAARREEVPPFFARLRPPQMLVAVISLLALLPKA